MVKHPVRLMGSEARVRVMALCLLLLTAAPGTKGGALTLALMRSRSAGGGLQETDQALQTRGRHGAQHETVQVSAARGRGLQETGPKKEAVVGLIPALLQGGLNFTRTPEYCQGDWSGGNAVSKYVKGPCVGISGIGAIETPIKTVYIIDRSDHINTYLKLPNNKLAFAEELVLATGYERPLDVRTNTFCSSGQYIPDGSFVSIGGYMKALDTQGYTMGAFSIRRIVPGGDFRVVARMTSARWYPTTQVLADGRVVIVGGSIEGGGIIPAALNNPTLEYYPKPPSQGAFNVPILTSAIPYALYPFVYLLPSGKLFIFAGNQYALYDTLRNKQGPSRFYPGSRSVVFSYPITGTSFMYPLRPENGYTPEIMVCGGGEKSTKDKEGYTSGKVLAPAYQYCHTVVDPEAPQPVWLNHLMTFPRVMPNAVLLADGSALITGGAQTGFAGIPVFVSKPAYQPEIFNTRAHRFYPVQLAASKVPRLYHSSAMLLHDATVMLSGSNPNVNINLNNGIGTTQFKVEYFYPPHVMGGGNAHTVVWAPAKIRTGSLPFSITVNCTACPTTGLMKRVRVSLAYPGFSTHSFNHGMRNVDLELVRVMGRRSLTITVKTPPNKNIAPPTYYWLFVLVDGKPNRDGRAIWIK